jgi:hypothetical protein
MRCTWFDQLAVYAIVSIWGGGGGEFLVVAVVAKLTFNRRPQFKKTKMSGIEQKN